MRRYVALAVVTSLGLGGCSYIPFLHTSTGPQYADSQVMKPLAVPPDLLAQVPAPGVTIPGGAVNPATVADSTVGGYGVFQPREAPGQQPVEEKSLAGVGSQILGSGADLSLSTQAQPAQIWSAVKATLADSKTPIEKFAPEQGELVTGWHNFRTGIAAFFGNTLAPSHRERYAFHLQPGADGAQVLSIQQERYWNNPQGSSVEWKKVPADADHNRDLLKAIQKHLQQTSILAEMPKIKVTRYRDDRGPYLVLNAVPAKAQPAVEMALQGLGYPVRSEGLGDWTVMIHAGSQQAAKKSGFFGGMFSRAWSSIQDIWSSPKDREPVSVRVRLLAMKDDSGSVLETEPKMGKKAPEAALEVLNKLQTALTPQAEGNA
ncbi:hypothetical protein B1757_08995 [Acidithiobacillus marinus]|uniref:Outer membrane protein assembly factor BamC n=1 Tax=Acidithiobacillus marinus TaxID=187490 RepID=A0A2I1DLF3_9PROT|nr:outer membrane protein assembly factor BamC [Acidithiobacillus marinus]PKY10700.1 hypothetical protein B1757_08995 [Acidithiobacillus marinus]